MFVCIQAPDAGVFASSFSPWVESIGATAAVISLTPRQLAERVWERIPAPPAQVAVAATVEAAILAAHNLAGCTFIAPGEETRGAGTTARRLPGSRSASH